MTLELSEHAPAEPLPEPSPLTVRRVKRVLGRTAAAVTRVFEAWPPGRWLHARLRAHLEVTVVDVALGRPGDSGAELPKIAFLSDLHAGHYMRAPDLEALASLLMALRPDVVCLGGDLIHTSFGELAGLDRALRLLRAPLGVFAVPGNHDYARVNELAPWLAHMDAHGVRVLMNRGQRLELGGRSLWLCGVDDLTEGRPDLDAALRGRRADEPTVLLSHHPDVFRVASRAGVDLQLSGHTHGGQIRLLGWSPYHHSHMGYEAGLYRHGRGQLFVSRGAGVSLLPLRIGTRAEVSLLRLKA